MSLSSVGSSNPYAYLQWPLQSQTIDSGDPSPPSDPLQALFGAFSGGGSSDPLLSSAAATGSAPNNSPQLSPDVMAALFSLQTDQTQSGGSRLQALFGKFDANGDGQISQSEFENAIGSNVDPSKVDALFAKLDGNGDGSVSQSELQSALQQAHGGHHHHHHSDEASGAQGGDPLQSLLSSASADGATSQSTSNSDGSSTTTISYADGTKIEMTTPAASSDAGSAAPPSNSNALNFSRLLQQLIGLQAQLAAPTTNLTV